MKLDDIEKAYDFSYPSLYKKMEADGMLDVVKACPGSYHLMLWHDSNRATYLEKICRNTSLQPD